MRVSGYVRKQKSKTVRVHGYRRKASVKGYTRQLKHGSSKRVRAGSYTRKPAVRGHTRKQHAKRVRVTGYSR
jgi:hypothetical protein